MSASKLIHESIILVEQIILRLLKLLLNYVGFLLFFSHFYLIFLQYFHRREEQRHKSMLPYDNLVLIFVKFVAFFHFLRLDSRKTSSLCKQLRFFVFPLTYIACNTVFGNIIVQPWIPLKPMSLK